MNDFLEHFLGLPTDTSNSEWLGPREGTLVDDDDAYDLSGLDEHELAQAVNRFEVPFDGELLERNPYYAPILSSLCEDARVGKACQSVGIKIGTLVAWKRKDPDFGKAVEEAKLIGMQTLKDEALRRAQNGWLEPVFHQGVECGAKRKFSDGLAQFLLEGAFPEEFRKRVDVQGSITGPLNTLVVPATMSVDEWIKQNSTAPSAPLPDKT